MKKSNDEILFQMLMHIPFLSRQKMFSAMKREGMEVVPPHGFEGGPRGGHGFPCGHPHGGHGPQGFHDPHGHHHGKGPFSRERVLNVLLEEEEGLRQKAIAEELGVNASSMSELIDKLESDGYLERTADPADKRATLIRLTEKGRARGYELQDERAERLSALFQNLSEEEKETLIALLHKMLEEPEA